jgi:hypothetical protein
VVMAEVGAFQRRGVGNHTAARSNLARLLPPLVGGLAVLLALIGLIGTAIRDPKPHDIPVGLVGPVPAVHSISASFGSAAPGAFKFTSYDSESAARAALDQRSVDGVLVVGSGTPRLILAGASGDGSTGVITGAFTKAFQAQGAALTVETVHAFPAGDSHGLLLFFVVVAVLISTLVAQALLGVGSEAGFGARFLVAVLYGTVAGVAGMASAAWITGGYGSGFWTAAALMALASTAVGAVVAGSIRLLGGAGLGLAALVVVLFDLVSSGGPAGSQLLPDFYRWLAPWMPAGELYSGLRGALFFDGAGLGLPLAVLTGWLFGGLGLMLLGELAAARRRSLPAAPAQ